MRTLRKLVAMGGLDKLSLKAMGKSTNENSGALRKEYEEGSQVSQT